MFHVKQIEDLHRKAKLILIKNNSLLESVVYPSFLEKLMILIFVNFDYNIKISINIF